MEEYEKYLEKQKVADEGVQEMLSKLRQGQKFSDDEVNKKIAELVKIIMGIGKEKMKKVTNIKNCVIPWAYAFGRKPSEIIVKVTTEKNIQDIKKSLHNKGTFEYHASGTLLTDPPEIVKPLWIKFYLVHEEYVR